MRTYAITLLSAFIGAGVVAASEVELKWDNGSPGVYNVWYGNHYWIGNDFDVQTFKTTYVRIKQIGVFTTPSWPNNRWDGFRIAVWSQQPSQIMWGPTFVIGNGFGAAWHWFDVDYELPRGCTSFIAAMEQTYYYPACDPYYLDTGPCKGHSWKRSGADTWEPLSPNANLMLRVRAAVGITYPGVEPLSLGRIKALYQ